MADVLLAMRPEWLELILSGRKTAEFRRVMPKQIKSGDWVYLYCKGYIHGRVRVAGMCYGSSLALARSFAKEGCIRLEDALVYLHLAKSPGVIKLGEVQRNEHPVRWEGVGHPQNFIYLEGAEQGWVVTEVPCSEDRKKGKK